VANEVIIGLRITEIPYLIYSMLRLFGNLPGLIISIRLSKMKRLIGASSVFNQL